MKYNNDMKYAVINASGSQYKVEEGSKITVDKFDGEKGDMVDFNEVLLLVDGENAKIGTPFVKDAKVKAEVLEQFRGKKIRVATYKAKSRYRRVIGHRSDLVRLEIKKILALKTKTIKK